MSEACLFCKIGAREISARIVHEDDEILAFEDIDPKAPTHVLVIPKLHLETLSDLGPEHQQLAGRLLLSATEIARERGLDRSGYRLVANCGAEGGQAVYHIHVHLLGGRQLGWPPG